MNGLVYVNKLGMNVDEDYIYEMYFSSEPEYFWITDADIKPAGICNIGVPEKSVYDSVSVIKTKIDLNVAQKNSCFSFQDCKDGVLPVAWENIDGYDEYPDNGRIVLRFGTDFDEVSSMLGKRDIFIDNKDNNVFNF